MITFDKVSKEYATSTRPALDEIDLQIEKGEFVFLIGPSGSGKSTFLQLLIRDTNVTKGDIHFADFHVNKLKGSEINKLRQRIGYVFQDFRLLSKLNVYDNVAFALEVIGERPQRIKSAPWKHWKWLGWMPKPTGCRMSFQVVNSSVSPLPAHL